MVRVVADIEIRITFGSIPIKSTRHPKPGAAGKIALTEGNANKAARQIPMISTSLRMCSLRTPKWYGLVWMIWYRTEKANEPTDSHTRKNIEIVIIPVLREWIPFISPANKRIRTVDDYDQNHYESHFAGSLDNKVDWHFASTISVAIWFGLSRHTKTEDFLCELDPCHGNKVDALMLQCGAGIIPTQCQNNWTFRTVKGITPAASPWVYFGCLENDMSTHPGCSQTFVPSGSPKLMFVKTESDLLRPT